MTPSSPLPHLQPRIAVGLFVLLAVVGLIWEYTKIPTSSPPPLAMNQDSRIQKVNQPNAFFYTDVLLNRNKTFISLPYRFEANPQPLWLSVATGDPQVPILFAMDHPAFHLGWQQVGNDQLTLFQKEPRYATINAFLASPPQGNRISLDPSLMNRAPYNKLGAQELTDITTGNEVDYILTAYRPPRTDGNWLYFETTFDATSAVPTSDHKLKWYLQAPHATQENPYYLGEIHVDYRQQ